MPRRFVSAAPRRLPPSGMDRDFEDARAWLAHNRDEISAYLYLAGSTVWKLPRDHKAIQKFIAAARQMREAAAEIAEAARK